MALQLREDLSFCDCGGRIIFLDLKADRYFCLGSSLEATFRRWSAASANDGEGEGFDALRARNLLVPADLGAPGEPTARAVPAKGDLAANGPRRALDYAEALASEMAASLWLRSRPLRAIVGRCRTRGTIAAGAPDRIASARRLATAFAFSAFVLGATDRCLVRGVAATWACRRRGLPAALVFGVRIDPFAAHCWVQLGEEVLVGDFEQVRLFTPILTVP